MPVSATAHSDHVFATGLKNKKSEMHQSSCFSYYIEHLSCSVPPPLKKPPNLVVLAYICTSSPTADCKNIPGWWLLEVDPRSAAEALWILLLLLPRPQRREKKNLQCSNAKFMEKSSLLLSGNASCLRGEADSRQGKIGRSERRWCE